MSLYSTVDNASATHPQMENVIETNILLGNKTLFFNFQENNVYLKIQHKTRQISSTQAVLCARYDLKFSENHQQIWMLLFIIPSNLGNIQQFLEEFANLFLISDGVLTAASLHNKCHFQNRLNQHELDEAKDNLVARFKADMASKHIIIIEDNDTMISQWNTYLKTEFDPDLTQLRYKPTVYILFF
jgi:sulfur transfer complex TusBCD TusB component (DsrH family)